MNLRAFLALLAGAIIIAFAVSFMLPLQRRTSGTR